MTFENLKKAKGSKIAVQAAREELESFIRTLDSCAIKDDALAVKKEGIESRLRSLAEKYMETEEKAILELEHVNDGEIFAILQWKYMGGLSWSQIATKFADNPTPESIKKRCQRYLKEHEDDKT